MSGYNPSLFGEAEKPSSKIKLSEPKPKAKLPEIKLEPFQAKKEVAKEVKEEKKKRENRVSSGELNPLTSEQRAILFPNGPRNWKQLKFKPKKKLPAAIPKPVLTLSEQFKADFLDCSDKEQETLVLIYKQKGMTALQIRDVFDDLRNYYGYTIG